MLPMRSWVIMLCVMGLLETWAVSAARGQVSIREQFTTRGTVEAVTPGRLTVRDEQGGRLEVRIQGRDERGVMLTGGGLLAFPAEVRVTGSFDVTTLAPGQLVRFRGRLNAGGRAEGDVEAITLLDASDDAIGVACDAEPGTPLEFVACEVTAAVRQATKGRLTVTLPEERAFHRKTSLSFRLGPGVQVGLESGDPRRIEPGARVERLDAVRLDTGDVLVRRIAVVNAVGTAVTERGDERLANKYRSLSDEPKTEPRLIRSPHFAFLTDVSDREARIILDKLERMTGLLERYFGRRPAGVVEGFIVRDLGAFPPDALPEPAGVAKIREGAGVCFNVSLGGQRKATLSSCVDHGVIQHECTHGFCHMTFGSPGPTWLAEGVAELGNYWRDGDEAVAVEPVVLAYLRQARPKRSLEEIVIPGRAPAGTWQDYAWRWALCHLLAHNPNYADRFKPLAIALMEGRPDVSFESVYGATAREVAFEYDQFLAHVGNGYRADLTAWPWKAKFRRLPSGGGLKATVGAAAGWQASGLRVERGGSYEVATDGEWRTARAAAARTADGDSDGHGRLIGAVLQGGEKDGDPAGPLALGEVIPLGRARTFVAPVDGRLFLRCADDWTQLSDHDGEITVTLRRAAAE
ncbi:MAG: hypothetical protein ACKOHG_03565 [Planctomycetia bacterium]